MWIK
jgi:predicted histone-like DNA-binding protein